MGEAIFCYMCTANVGVRVILFTMETQTSIIIYLKPNFRKLIFLCNNEFRFFKGFCLFRSYDLGGGKLLKNLKDGFLKELLSQFQGGQS